MTQYRWITSALVGPWCLTKVAAMSDALNRGQASLNPGNDELAILRTYATLERHPA